MKRDLTNGRIISSLLAFSGPMILGNLLQQVYNIADTFIVGRYLGENALAAVGSTYTLTTFLYSIIIGLCMGSGSLVSYCFGEKNERRLKSCLNVSFVIIGSVTVVTELITLCFSNGILRLLRTPVEIIPLTSDYVNIILAGIIFIFMYNFYSFMLRGLGNSITPLIFLGSSSVLNILLDVAFVAYMDMGVKGAAYATVIAQAVSGVGLCVYSLVKEPLLRLSMRRSAFKDCSVSEVVRMSTAASVQQSVMNFGILMIQGLVNSFGTTVMAAFTVAVKIDTVAYMPAQEFGNAFSLFISQNFGAKKYDRIKSCVRYSCGISALFCAAVSVFVAVFSDKLMGLFVRSDQTDIIAVGSRYLITEGSFYVGIGILFLLYGYYRGINRPEMSLVLTVISLGTRVALAYFLSSFDKIGVFGIWLSIPIGWVLADIVGITYMKRKVILDNGGK